MTKYSSGWFLKTSVFMCHLCRIEELTCGGMVEQVQEAFGETMTSVVSLCARYPIACANSIGLLCTIPYTRQDKPSCIVSLIIYSCTSDCSSFVICVIIGVRSNA